MFFLNDYSYLLKKVLSNMKKLIIIFILSLLVQKLYGSKIISLPFITVDVVFSKNHDKLFAVIDVMDTEFGNR